MLYKKILTLIFTCVVFLSITFQVKSNPYVPVMSPILSSYSVSTIDGTPIANVVSHNAHILTSLLCIGAGVALNFYGIHFANRTAEKIEKYNVYDNNDDPLIQSYCDFIRDQSKVSVAAKKKISAFFGLSLWAAGSYLSHSALFKL